MLHSFPVLPLDRFKRSQTVLFQKPQEIFCFSTWYPREDEQLVKRPVVALHCASQLSRYVNPFSWFEPTKEKEGAEDVVWGCKSTGAATHRPRVDLNSGFPTQVTEKVKLPPSCADISQESPPSGSVNLDVSKIAGMESLLSCIAQFKRDPTTGVVPRSPDFLAWRGVLTTLMCTPYDSKPWELVVTRKEGVIHLLLTQERVPMDSTSPSTDRMTYWGHRFERYCTTTTSSPSTNEQQHPGAHCMMYLDDQYISVVRTRLGKHSLWFGGEVDAYHPNPSTNATSRPETCYVELKTNRVLTHPGQRTNFYRYKLLRCWAQSFLIGVGEIIWGFRDDAGIVQEIQHMRVSEIPRLVREVPGAWDPNVCLNFLDTLLSWIKDQMKAAVSHTDAIDAVYSVATETDPYSRKVVNLRWTRRVGIKTGDVLAPVS